MTDHTVVWQMGKLTVESCHGGFVIKKRNALGREIWSSEPITGHKSQKVAIAAARKKYAEDCE